MAASREHVSTKVIKSVNKSSNEKRVIVILERASLESVKVHIVFVIQFTVDILTAYAVEG